MGNLRWRDQRNIGVKLARKGDKNDNKEVGSESKSNSDDLRKIALLAKLKAKNQ